MKNFKKYGNYIMLLLVVAVWVAYPLYYDIAVELEKYEQRQLMNDPDAQKHFVILRLATKNFDLHYDEAEQELNIQGEMYDVVKIDVRNEEHVVCVVLPDKKESKLNNHFSRLLKSRRDGKTHRHHSFWLPIAFCHEKLVSLLNLSASISISYESYYRYSLSGDYIQDISKPPEGNC